uniref:ATP synthase complex subunit 8 n=1 Tax=Pan troglodytes troglodytes TaxID=37011 RepID=G4X0A2_PANTR|nr:ATPase subunit 8 [Pan troglodytes troglodytes]
MPQLNTAVWPTMITPMLLTLFLVTQLKMLNSNYHLHPSPKPMKMKTTMNPENQNERKSIRFIRCPYNP